MSEKEMNMLGAKLVKAEMMGNTVLAEKLKAKLETARQAKQKMAETGGTQVLMAIAIVCFLILCIQYTGHNATSILTHAV